MLKYIERAYDAIPVLLYTAYPHASGRSSYSPQRDAGVWSIYLILFGTGASSLTFETDL